MARHHESNRQLDADSSLASRPSQPTTLDTKSSSVPVISVQGSLQAPRPQPLRLVSRQREPEQTDRECAWQQERSEQRQEYLWRKQLDVRFERQRLNAEEQALQQAWDSLPQPESRLLRLIVALMIIAGSISLIVIYPMVIVPLIIVLLIVVRVRRRNRWQPGPRTAWIAQERHRIQSRVAWIDARIAALAQEEQAISSELLALSSQDTPEC